MRYVSAFRLIVLFFALAPFREEQSVGQSRVPKTLFKDLPFEMNAFNATSFPKRSVSIEKYGAVGDGITDNTKAISEAISYISGQGGGTVNIPEGLWFTGPIVFKSNVRLNLERGALLLFSNDKSRYPIVETIFEGLTTRRCQSPISGRNLQNIAITGQGVIDGNGDAWRAVKKEKLTEAQWKKLVASGGIVNSKNTEWYPSESFRRGMELSTDQNVPSINSDLPGLEIKDFLRPVMVSFMNCRNVLLDGVTFQNSPAWCLHPLICENVIISM
ncbi:MAG: glycosyl hydrolase family 28-related protein [Bacteroidales bacterium]